MVYSETNDFHYKVMIILEIMIIASSENKPRFVLCFFPDKAQKNKIEIGSET